MWVLAEVETSTALFLAGLVLMIGVFLLRSQRQVVRANQAYPRPAVPPVEPEPLRGRGLQAPGDYERWEVEMHDLARELTARLDTKIALLQQLLRAADEQGQRLTDMLEQASRWTTPEAQRTVASAVNEQTSHTQYGRMHPPASRHVATQAAALTAVGPVQHVSIPQQEPSDSPSRPFDEIFALAAAGESPDSIARLVDTPVGEVELILSLRKEQLALHQPTGPAGR